MKTWILVALLSLAASPAGAVVLSGNVTRSDTGEPVAGAVVVVRGTDLTEVTNGLGDYTLVDVPAGVYGLSCGATGLLGQATGALDLTEDASRDFSLDPPGADTAVVSGTVTCGGIGCLGVVVQARQDGRTQRQTVSLAGGAYQLSGLTPGAYDLRAIATGYAVAEALAVQASVELPATRDLALTAAGPYTLRGVVGLSDNPLDRSGSTVRVYGRQPPTSTTTSTGGLYTLEGVPAGFMSAAATHPGYDWHHRLDLLVQGDRTVDFVLQLSGGNGGDPTYRVAGTVRLEDPDGGDPITAVGTRVSLWQPGTGPDRTTSTGADGAYAFNNVPAGTWQIAAAREGYQAQTQEPFGLDANRTQDFELSLDPDYDWGPGEADGDLGCTCGSGRSPGGAGLLLIAFCLALARRRR